VSTTAPDAGYCQSNGYDPPDGTSCPKGMCLATGTSEPCCGSLCPTCESKGLVSYTDAGTCPPGFCPSADVTVELQCCDDMASSLASGAYCEPAESGTPDSGQPEASPVEASVDSGLSDAAGD
jgi:hypothetical protein